MVNHGLNFVEFSVIYNFYFLMRLILSIKFRADIYLSQWVICGGSFSLFFGSNRENNRELLF